MTHDELSKIEAAEFEDALRSCLRQRAFRKLCAHWFAELRENEQTSPLPVEGIAEFNFYAGQSSVFAALRDHIETLAPTTAERIQKETTKHVRRRADAE